MLSVWSSILIWSTTSSSYLWIYSHCWWTFESITIDDKTDSSTVNQSLKNRVSMYIMYEKADDGFLYPIRMFPVRIHKWREYSQWILQTDSHILQVFVRRNSSLVPEEPEYANAKVTTAHKLKRTIQYLCAYFKQMY